MMIDPVQLDALSTAVAEGTFDAAARALHVTPSAVSQRIKTLETRVGRVLLVRTKPIRATEAGLAVLRLARQIAALTEDVAREIGSDADIDPEPTRIALGVNADSLSTWVLPALAGLTGSMAFTFYRSDEFHTADLLRQGDVMAAITASSRPLPGCASERLGTMRYSAMASPTFVTRWFADGVTGASLAAAPVVSYDREDHMHERFLRRHSRRPLQPPRHHIPSTTDFLTAVSLGYGWGLIPKLQLDRTPDHHPLIDIGLGRSIDVVLHWQHWRLPSTALDRVSDAVRTAARLALT
jgi:LysR family transcriptional regulator (chromosome initiation inhibitor)